MQEEASWEILFSDLAAASGPRGHHDSLAGRRPSQEAWGEQTRSSLSGGLWLGRTQTACSRCLDKHRHKLSYLLLALKICLSFLSPPMCSSLRSLFAPSRFPAKLGV